LRRNFLAAILILAALFSAGVVYAAAAPTLRFTGRTVSNPVLNVVFENPAIASARAGETISLGPDSKTLLLYVVLVDPGDSRTVNIIIRNLGNIPAKLGRWDATVPAQNTGVVIAWPQIAGLRLEPGEAHPCSIVVSRPSSAYNVIGGTTPFEASIGYTQ